MADRNIALPDPRLLVRIEEEFWTDDGTVPPDVSAVVRGAPRSSSPTPCARRVSTASEVPT
jgi:hypothetical protein